ncbi:MAG: N-acetyl-alpha-D-glucosaminyl L-malate synthase BshA [Planctomycetota bacterium]|jgi:N-acetyl-alpha-D-glucosaminyl L-malate synthase BshA
MRIAVVCYPTYGGSGAVAADVSQRLAERGHEVHVVSYDRPFRLDRHLPNLLLHTVEVGDYPLFRYPPYTLNLANKLLELIHEHGVELIHSHYAIPHAVAAWQAAEVVRAECGRRIALACTLHGTDITLVGRERGYHALTRFAIQRQDLRTAPSRWLVDETAKHFAESRIEVIPNAVDTERFRPDPAMPWRRTLAPDDHRIVTHVSNFRPVKRVEEVVGAFATLRKRMKATLVLVGEGPDLPKAEQLARDLGVRDDLRLLGLQAPEPVLQASDLFLLPSRSESFGLAALEAMACGVPVLGYHAGGLPEVVEDGVSGVLCPEGHEVCLGSLAANLLADESRFARMRVAARDRALQFAPEPVVDAYERALLGILRT